VANISVDKSTDISVLTEKVNQTSQQSAIGAANTSGMVHNLTSVNLSQGLWLPNITTVYHKKPVLDKTP
jgi:hypothetical protein